VRGRDRSESPHRGSRWTRSRRAEALAIALILASCTASSVPRPRFPQVEQATEALQGGGERYRTHRACAAAAKSVDDLVRCREGPIPHRENGSFVDPHGHGGAASRAAANRTDATSFAPGASNLRKLR